MKSSLYLDYAATTPVDPLVAEKMLSCLTSQGLYGNPASQHDYGYAAAQAITQAAQQVASLIHAAPQEIIWTSGATEANNLALKGIAEFYAYKGKHIITSRIEHKSVLDVCRYLEKQGYQVSYLSPSANGLIDPQDVAAAMRPDTILVSIMHVNNEIGVIQDIAAISKIVKQHHCLFHVDAAQSAGKIVVDVDALGIDLMSLSGHKVYGPKGIGALFVRQKPPIKLVPQMQGGSQQHGLRAGTLPTHQIVGMGEAFAIAESRLLSDSEWVTQLRSKLLASLEDIPGLNLVTPLQRAIPHILNLSFTAIHSEALLYGLRNIALSSGSACDSALMEPSYVLKAIGLMNTSIRGAIRISLGRYTTVAEIDYFSQRLKQEVARLRAISPLWNTHEV